GAICRLLWSALGAGWALGLSSALFGAVHLIKPGADLMAVLGIIFCGGIPLAGVYLLTHRLGGWGGYHGACNVPEGYVFGAQVSGTEAGPSLYHVRPVAGIDPLWSGGAFGPEASVARGGAGVVGRAALPGFAAGVGGG